MTDDNPDDKPTAGPAGDVQPLPAELVTEMLAEPAIRDLLTHIYNDAGLDTAFENVPREVHASILARLVAEGHIRLAEPDA